MNRARLHELQQSGSHQKAVGKKAPSEPPSEAAVSHAQALGLTLPLDITVSNSNARRRTKSFVYRVYAGDLPKGSVIDIGDGVCIASPELCFMQMAGELSLVELVQLGMELCGSFSIGSIRSDRAGKHGDDPNRQVLSQDDNSQTLYEQPALTSTRKLRALLTRMAGTNGKKKSLSALRHIADGSASPMEANLIILLTLPYRLGGYGLSMPKLNQHFDLTQEARRATGRNYLKCDLYWPEARVAVEYDSDMFHTGSFRIGSDAIRRIILSSMKITVISITNQQVKNQLELEQAVKLLAQSIKRQLRTEKNPKFREVQRQLRSALL